MRTCGADVRFFAVGTFAGTVLRPMSFAPPPQR